MTTGYYLLDHQNPNARPRPDGRYFGRYRRRKPLSLIVIHSAENQPDFDPPDDGAEAVARYNTVVKRPSSYHTVVDSDSIIPLLPPDHESYNCRYGVNAYSWGVSMATRADSWGDVPTEWRAQIGLNLMKVCAIISDQYDIPAVKLTREQAMSGQKGYVDHKTMDPWRRHDPGWGDNEWTEFLKGVSTMIDVDPIDPPGPPSTGPIAWALADNAQPNGRLGYWEVDRTGKVTSRNDAPHHGDLPTLGVVPSGPIVDIISPDGKGYWLVAADGGLFAFGAPYPPAHADFMVQVAPHLVGDIRAAEFRNREVVFIASDGGTFAFGV